MDPALQEDHLHHRLLLRLRPDRAFTRIFGRTNPISARYRHGSPSGNSEPDMIAAAKELPWREALDIELDELADFRGISISPVQPALVNSNDERPSLVKGS
jgi:hypothetical protein